MKNIKIKGDTMERLKLTVKEGKAQVRLIETVWQKIAYTFEGIHHGCYGRDFLNECIEEEKRHDKCRPVQCKRFLTIREAGKLFVVKRLCEYLFTNETVDLLGYHYTQKSVYTAYSLAKTYEKELKEALTGVDYALIESIDYADLESIAD